MVRKLSINQDMAPCPCGLDAPYKFCHKDIDAASAADKVAVTQKSYASRWAINAKSLEEDGSYSWMAEQLRAVAPRRILDVGAGSGRGVAALSAHLAPEILISVDENSACLQTALGTLRSAGVDAQIHRELSAAVLPGGLHVNVPSTDFLRAPAGTMLVGADLLTDGELIQRWLNDHRCTLDAITVWLIGTHFEKFNEINISAMSINSASNYRLLVQRTALLFASTALRAGGVVHCVDRGGRLSKEAEYVEWLRTVLLPGSSFTIAPSDIAQVPFRDTQDPRRVRAPIPAPETFLTSLLFRKSN